ncbi:hypothetical protein HNQ06_000947 [Borrelia lanei]|uniref:Uncharacterized protein n=1 Tax=Borreliella lanei TaxID=373540 RepID=A0A7W9ZBM6_9SPIR|nr:hypothetical protein [Borreliella lanei]MBB6208417.1 hypothetical protein [Borreliella lanei]
MCKCNNNIKEERKVNQIEKYQVKKYYNKSKLKSKNSLSILNLDINKKEKIEVIKIIKRIEIELIKRFNMRANKSYFKEKQDKLRKILSKENRWPKTLKDLKAIENELIVF